MNCRQPVMVYVEDDEASIIVMKAIVERVMKLQTLHVLQNRPDFVQQVKQLGVQPDIFLFDIQMKPYNGFELLSMLRADPQFENSKVVALTASVMSEEVAGLKHRGFDGAIAKPINIDAFPGLITRIMDGESVWYIV
ncbi:MAG: response regulator [Anaerolineales bacterium]|nr:MAG: response regulator [Anaerolineales bacterium]